ncbi:MAG: selenium-dependent molybdenum cofactor biosynthesis protein YqeB [Candidatus Promineifilaceae bacterium]
MKVDTSQELVVIRGGGDLATGIVYRLHKAGFPVVVLELPRPLVVRRTVAVAAAVLQGEVCVEGMIAQRVDTVSDALALAQQRVIPVMPSAELPAKLTPTIVIDARMAKRNIDTQIEQAPLVIALGPGFTAGTDCHAVVETMRGHRLGRVIWNGAAIPDTGTPGIVAGKGAERVLRAPVAGIVAWQVAIGDLVTKGQQLGTVAESPVNAPFEGVVRGLIMDGLTVRANLKIGDVDARADKAACYTISDKALSIAGGVMEAIFTK